MDNNMNKTRAFRFLAFLVDMMLSANAFIVPAYFLSLSQDEFMFTGRLIFTLVLYFLVYPVLLPLVSILFLNTFGATPGKMITGIGVYPENGKRNLTLSEAFFRNYAGYMLSSLFFGLGFVWILLEKKGRGWHDLIAGSIVKVRSERSLLMITLSLSAIMFFAFMLTIQSIRNFSGNGKMYDTMIKELRQTYPEKPIEEKFYQNGLMEGGEL